ncbi:MAG TPA: bifunctional lysylphosphatidylglycerol synthetase/lysine--tRNA ligase LysX [Actinomycetes bacterium]|nr:bifunctional lysylphosphatidylglycerol synthetase/lysine--tRNA ligase LysX [Actinomycetes bacterium]
MTTPPNAPDDLPEQMRVRREKLQRLREDGIDPYAFGYARTLTIADLRTKFAGLDIDVVTGEQVGIVGRVVLNRVSGKIIFASLRDGTGDVQVMLTLDASGAELLDRWKSDVDLGDHLGVTGEVITSKRGELSVLAKEFTITSKCLRPLPEKHAGLTDPEARVRQRYVDLIVRPEARDMLYLRSTLVRGIRESLQRRGFTEVETPMLQVMHGGANARPFESHINAYDMPVYLRIAPELYLKRIMVGGVEKVFEINRNFRNEGADSTHNPEFTMLEMYEAYGDYNTMRILTQEVIQEAATAVFGSAVARRAQPDGEIKEFDLSGDWPVKTMLGSLSEALEEEVTLDTPVARLRKLAETFGLDEDPTADAGMLLEELYVELVESKTTTPVFYQDFPKNNAPLTRLHRDDARLTEKWDLVCWGAEQGTGYSELIDPIDQRERFLQQAGRAAGGDAEAMRLDEDFLRALEFGMPPTGGQGMGIDRLIMTLTGLGVRDTILFPLVKPE